MSDEVINIVGNYLEAKPLYAHVCLSLTLFVSIITFITIAQKTFYLKKMHTFLTVVTKGSFKVHFFLVIKLLERHGVNPPPPLPLICLKTIGCERGGGGDGGVHNKRITHIRMLYETFLG